MYRRTFAILISVLALGAFAAGCGDDDESTETVTKAEYVEVGDAACKEAVKTGREELEEYLSEQNDGKLPSRDQEEELIETVIVPLLEKQIEGLEEAGLPKGSEKEAEAFLTELESVKTEAEENPVGTAASGTPFAESEAMAQALGFKECGHN